jgi:myo-inositol 2-dehydrogenase/D-chiro-inositol 1-dehydrogenase
LNVPEARKLRICQIGCGGMGELHAKCLLPHPQLASLTLCDADTTRAHNLALELGADDMPLDAALSADDFDAYFIASPPFSHLGQIKRAAKTGAYVFCEKPLGESLASIEIAFPDLLAYRDRVQIGFNRRFDPHMAELRRRISAGAVGDIEQLTIVSRDHLAPPVDGLANSAGLLVETTIHDFDLARWLLEDEITEVMCMGDALINPEYKSVGHIDTATTMLRGARGQQVVIQNSWRTSYGYDQRVEAFGAGGKLSVANPAGPLVTQEDSLGLHRGLIATDWLVRYPEAYAIQATAFLDAVLYNTGVSPNLTDGYRASYLAQKAIESIAAGQPVLCEPNH